MTVERDAKLVKVVLTSGEAGLELGLLPAGGPLNRIAYMRSGITAEWISGIMETVGLTVITASSGSLLSEPCRVRLTDGAADEIGHATKDQWFRFRFELASLAQLPSRDFVAEALRHINARRAGSGLRPLNTDGWTDDDVLIEARRCGWTR